MDGSKTIDSKEFLYLMYLWVGGKFFSGLPNEDSNILKRGFKLLEQVFQHADTDRSTTIDMPELKSFLALLNGHDEADQDLSEMLERWNLEAGDKLDFYTFLWCVSRHSLRSFSSCGEPLPFFDSYRGRHSSRYLISDEISRGWLTRSSTGSCKTLSCRRSSACASR